MAKNTPISRIPDAQLEIMQVIWNNPVPITTKDVKRELEKKRPWSTGALQTLLNRLIARQFLKSGHEGKSKTYIPLVSEKEYLAAEGHSFFERFSKNSITRLVTALYDTDTISEEDLDELTRYIEETKRNTH